MKAARLCSFITDDNRIPPGDPRAPAAPPPRRADAGAVLAEASMGLALLILVWIFATYVSYLTNNQIRCSMAVRHLAWLQGHGGTADLAVAQSFFFGDDTQLVSFQPLGNATLNAGNVTAPGAGSVQGNEACLVGVQFGLPADQLAGTDRYPFLLLNTHLPFMPDSSLASSFTMVSAQGAWPADVGTTWNTWGSALQGLAGLLGHVWSLVGGYFRP